MTKKVEHETDIYSKYYKKAYNEFLNQDMFIEYTKDEYYDDLENLCKEKDNNKQLTVNQYFQKLAALNARKDASDFRFNESNSLTVKIEDKDDKFNEVDKPKHYASGNIECIDAIKESMGHEGFCCFCKGNVLKYLWRYQLKNNPIQDLQKAQWYLNKLIETEKAKSSN